ncbi:MAG: hypothetical protein E7B11_26970 [Clostridiales bacterium]|nr:hypothetical protein [Clostridiales bacterium]MDU3244194.1 hypothetical protein [Clostridiales bacterium]
MNQKIWIILWGIGVVVWIGWVAGYPIYRKRRKKRVFGEGSLFAFGAVLCSLFISMINLIRVFIAILYF